MESVSAPERKKAALQNADSTLPTRNVASNWSANFTLARQRVLFEVALPETVFLEVATLGCMSKLLLCRIARVGTRANSAFVLKGFDS